MINLLFDARLIYPTKTGLARFTSNLLLALLKNGNPNKYFVTVILPNKKNIDSNYFKLLNSFKKNNKNVEFIFSNLNPFSLTQNLIFIKFGILGNFERYFYPHFNPPIFNGFLNYEFVIHDLIPLKFDGYIIKKSFFKKLYFKILLLISIRKCKKCFVVSKFTQNQLIELVGVNFLKKISVIPEGTALENFQINKTNYLEENVISKNNYLLYVGDRRPHKNIKLIIDIFIFLQKNYSYKGGLLIVGSPKNYNFDLENYIKELKVENIKILSKVKDDYLAELYSNAEALISLSSIEGFGLPLLEAANFGIKIIHSNCEAYKELSPEGSCMVELENSFTEICSQISNYLKGPNPKYSKDYIKKYTWKNTAKNIFPYCF